MAIFFHSGFSSSQFSDGELDLFNRGKSFLTGCALCCHCTGDPFPRSGPLAVGCGLRSPRRTSTGVLDNNSAGSGRFVGARFYRVRPLDSPRRFLGV